MDTNDWVFRKDWGKLRNLGMPANLDPEQLVDVKRRDGKMLYGIRAKEVAWTPSFDNAFAPDSLIKRRIEMTVIAYRIVNDANDVSTEQKLPKVGSRPILFLNSAGKGCEQTEQTKARHGKRVEVLSYIDYKTAVVWCPVDPYIDKTKTTYWVGTFGPDDFLLSDVSEKEEKALMELINATGKSLTRNQAFQLFCSISKGDLPSFSLNI